MKRPEIFLFTILLAGCSAAPGSDPGDDGGGGSEDPGPVAVRTLSPTIGSVAGGTRITVEGANLTASTHVEIGGFECGSVMVESPTRLSCTTGSSDFKEGEMDVVLSRGANTAMLPAAFTYQCPWTTSRGRRSCGAVPPGQVEVQLVASWLTQFEDAQSFVVSSDAPCNLADTTDFTIGSQSMWFETDGAATLATLSRRGMAPVDFTDKDFKIWIKIDNVAHLGSLDVWLGDSGLSNAFKFRLRSTQGQQWTTDGDWVSFTVPWVANGISGTPNRASVTDIMIRATDDATGVPVRIHVNGLAAVPEPVAVYPHGVLSFTFDDNWATGINPGAVILGTHNFPATEYVIMDTVGLARRATLADLQKLQTAGWDVSVHANDDNHHAARYPNLTTQTVEDDMVDARAWLIERGFKGFDHCAYPGGDFTGGADVLGNAGRYFASCRTIFNQQRETFPPSDSRKLRVFYVTNTVSLAAAEQAVDAAKQAHEWIIVVFHELVQTPGSSTEWAVSDFQALVDYVAASGIDVKTVGQVLAP